MPILVVIVVDQRNLGMSMRVERSSLDQVKKRFEMNKRKKEEKKKDYDFEERMKELKEEVCRAYFCKYDESALDTTTIVLK